MLAGQLLRPRGRFVSISVRLMRQSTRQLAVPKHVCDAYAFGSAFGVCCLSLGHCSQFWDQVSGCVRSLQLCHASRMMINAVQALTDSETEAPGPTKVEAGQTAPPPSVKDTKKETGKNKNPAIKKRPAAQGEQTKPKHGETHGVGLSEPVPGQQCPGEGREEGPVTYRLTPYAATQACAILRIAKGKRHQVLQARSCKTSRE